MQQSSVVLADRSADTRVVPDPTDRSPPRLGRVEHLAAQLGIWTPPRGVVVPPLSWRRVAGLIVAVVAALAAVVVLVVLPVAGNRHTAQQRSREAAAERHAAFLVSVDHDQRAHRGRGLPDPGRTATPRERRAARAALLESAEKLIRRDASALTSKHILDVACEPFPRALRSQTPVEELARPVATYDCTAVTARFGDSSTPGGAGIIGIPFRLVARFTAGTVAYCKVVPLSDSDRLAHPLPRACRGSAGHSRR
jgi:hypothetical protein